MCCLVSGCKALAMAALTNAERERLNYVSGRPRLAGLYAELDAMDVKTQGAAEAATIIDSVIEKLIEAEEMMDLAFRFANEELTKARNLIDPPEAVEEGSE